MESREQNKNVDKDIGHEYGNKHESPNLKGDYANIAILLLLYLLQGIPLGITYAIPILLQNRVVSYKEQAAFSFAFYPFTSKFQLDCS